VHHLVAGPDSASTQSLASSTSTTVDLVPTIYDLLGIGPTQGYQRLPGRARSEGETFAVALTDPTVPGKSTQFYTMLGQRSIYTRAGSPRRWHPPLSIGATSTRTSGSCSTWRPTGRSHNIWPPTIGPAEEMKSLWFYYAGIYNGFALDDRSALEQVLAERPRGGPVPRPIHLLPRLCRRSRVGRASHTRPARTPSPQA